MAMLGSRHSFTGPEPFMPIPQSTCKTAIKNWLLLRHAEWWTSYSGGVHTKRFFPTPSRKWSRELLFLEKKDIRRVVNAITGHCLLNKHLTTMGYLDNPRCDCDLDDETGFHLICECPRLRVTNLGRPF